MWKGVVKSGIALFQNQRNVSPLRDQNIVDVVSSAHSCEQSAAKSILAKPYQRDNLAQKLCGSLHHSRSGMLMSGRLLVDDSCCGDPFPKEGVGHPDLGRVRQGQVVQSS